MKIEPIRYYTNTHPLYRDGIEILFHFNGLPYVKVDDLIQTFSFNKFFEWIECKYINTVKRKEITIERITKAVCDYTLINKDVVFKKTRKREILQARQTIQYLSKLLTKKSLSHIGQNTGLKDHATVLHSYKTISDLLDIYPSWRKMIYDIREQLI
jgi:hypothetical protein